MPLDPRDSDLRLWGAPLAVLDFETTWEGAGGLDDPGQHPVQVAVVHWELGSRAEPRVALDELIRPPVRIRPEATAVHGLRDEDVSSAPEWGEVGERVLRALSGRVLVAYNLPFDWTVYDSATRRYGPEAHAFAGFPFAGLDPLVWSRSLPAAGRSTGHSLRDVARRRGIPTRGLHRAAADALLTARVSVPLLRDLHAAGTPLASVGDAWRATLSYARQWEDASAGYHAARGRDFDRTWRRLTSSGASE